ncbi:MAG: Fic family protein [Erysipelotrichia bacterium]|nr:Fic family protein [Erysipelotrichia bacterium]NCC53980.1 Fic family protein [Erysipelotrichia bacterium]
MIIDVKTIQFLKNTPNSAYQSVKTEFLYHSNKLEGSTFSKENLEKYLNEKIIEGSHKIDDVLETTNSTDVFDYAVETLDEALSKRLILDFHRILKDRTLDHERGFAGCWKKIPNQISGVDLKLAEPWEVEVRIEKLIQEWNDSQKGLEDIVKFHARFENIHPFQDGNGRIGRFLMLKQCIENGIDLIMIDDAYSKEYKKALYQAQKNQYYDELKEIFINCQDRLNGKLEFLQQTLDYIQKYDVDMNPNESM